MSHYKPTTTKNPYGKRKQKKLIFEYFEVKCKTCLPKNFCGHLHKKGLERFPYKEWTFIELL